MALRFVSGYHTMAHDAALVLVRITPLDLQARILKRVWFISQNQIRETGATDACALDKYRTKQRQQDALEEWRLRLLDGSYGRRVIDAFAPVLLEWYACKHVRFSYRITQVLLGHGSFQKFLHRIGNTITAVYSL